MPQVKKGSTVRVHYNVMLKSGKMVESTAGSDPLRLTVGAGKAIRAFEDALVGMGPGESKRVTIPPEKAFGVRKPEASSHHSHNDAMAPIGKDAAVLQQQVVNEGTTEEFSIIVTDKTVQLDENPRLAGEELVVDIDLVEIET